MTRQLSNVTNKRSRKNINRAAGKGEGYTVVGLSMDNDALKLLEKNWKDLVKYAKKKGIRKPFKSALLSKMIKKVGVITPDEYYG